MKKTTGIIAAIAAIGLWPALSQEPLPINIDSKLPTIFVIGDSTASNVDHRGWADPFADYFDLTKVNVVNSARAGRSSRTFQTEGLWDKVLDNLKAGDFVLIQWGHNDGGPIDKDRARGSLPGLGDESQEFTMPNGKTELVHTFGWYMRKLIADTRDRKSTRLNSSHRCISYAVFCLKK